MAKKMQVSNLFRKRLRQELDIWQTEGILNGEQARQISLRYKLDQLKTESLGTFLLTLYIVGAVLIAGGVVSFVAAHWASIGQWTKVSLIISAMLASHIVGFYLWPVSGKRPRLGHSLIVLGTLIFGANIGLLAQIFHIHSSYYNGFGAWAIGAIVMAYVLRSTPNALIALIMSFVWFCGWLGDYSHAFGYYPFVVAAVFLPFAYLKRSKLVFALTLLAIGISVPLYTAINSEQFWVWCLSMLAIGLLFYAWGLFSVRTKNFTDFGLPACVLGVFALALLTHLLSFHSLSEELDFDKLDGRYLHWIVLLAAISAVALVMWLRAMKVLLTDASMRPLALSVALTGLLVCVVLVLQDHIISVILANLALVLLAVGLTWSAIVVEDRRLFWLGILLFAVGILSRFLEYDTGLTAKAAAFIICGAGLIYGGIKFENYLRKRKLVHE